MQQVERGMRTSFQVIQHTLLVDLGQTRTILSSASCHGGLVRARYILNHQVPATSEADRKNGTRRGWGDPARYLRRVAITVGVEERCVALMTAVSMTQLVVVREAMGDMWVEGFVTVGVSNAVRAGESELAAVGRLAAPGTINIILVTNVRLTVSAMVGVVQVATESKTAALFSERVPSPTGQGATGTGTDAVVVAAGEGLTVRYSGTHTSLGALVGRLVSRGVTEGLRREQRWRSPQAARHDA